MTDTTRFTDEFSRAEREALAPYFTNVDRPVFVLVNLPETVKGALFARYSRSAKSLPRLFLDEFLPQAAGPQRPVPLARDPFADVGTTRAEQLYAQGRPGTPTAILTSSLIGWLRCCSTRTLLL